MIDIVDDESLGSVGNGGSGGSDHNIEVIGVELDGDFTLGKDNNLKISGDGGVGGDTEDRFFEDEFEFKGQRSRVQSCLVGKRKDRRGLEGSIDLESIHFGLDSGVLSGINGVDDIVDDSIGEIQSKGTGALHNIESIGNRRISIERTRFSTEGGNQNFQVEHKAGSSIATPSGVGHSPVQIKQRLREGDCLGDIVEDSGKTGVNELRGGEVDGIVDEGDEGIDEDVDDVAQSNLGGGIQVEEEVFDVGNGLAIGIRVDVQQHTEIGGEKNVGVTLATEKGGTVTKCLFAEMEIKGHIELGIGLNEHPARASLDRSTGHDGFLGDFKVLQVHTAPHNT